MAALVTQVLSDAGTKPSFVTASASDTGEIGSGTNSFLVVRNLTGSAITNVTITPSNQTSYGVALPAKVIASIAATTGEAWIPLRSDYSNGVTAGQFTVTGATGAQVAVVKLG